MKFFKQANLHKPEDGVMGDCHRTCMAIILGLERDDVPNFGEHFNDSAEWAKAVRSFLATLGLHEFATAFNCSQADLFSFMTNINPGIPFVLAGESANGVNHSVVCDHTGILWDPSLNDAGIVGPCDDGFYWIYLYVKATNA